MSVDPESVICNANLDNSTGLTVLLRKQGLSGCVHGQARKHHLWLETNDSGRGSDGDDGDPEPLPPRSPSRVGLASRWSVVQPLRLWLAKHASIPPSPPPPLSITSFIQCGRCSSLLPPWTAVDAEGISTALFPAPSPRPWRRSSATRVLAVDVLLPPAPMSSTNGSV